jgi:predicted phage replisome organizer
MADNKKYYYLKLKENFFDSDSMVLLESMQDGVLYSNILMKMYLKSLKNNGKLLLNDTIPYNTQMIATITRHQVGTVEKAIEVFNQLGLIDILDGGMIYMSDIELFVGQSSTEGDRKRAERLRLKQSDNLQIGQMSDIHPPEIEKEIELDKENRDRVNYQQIADMYNATCVSFPRLTVLSEKRKKAIKARLKKYSIDDIQRAFEMAQESDFLKGTNGRNWSATFDWIMCDSNMAKILDGNYANKDNRRTEGRNDTGGQAGRDESLTEMAIRAGIGDSFEGF